MKKERLLWTSIGMMGILIIYLLPWRYQVNDDVVMMWLISGSYTGHPESYVIFIHPIWSFFLAKLYSTFSGIPWYPIQTFSILGLSLFIGIQSIYSRFHKKNPRLFLLTILTLITWHFCFLPQFTLLAGWGTFLGILYLSQPNSLKIFKVLAWLLIIISSCIRLEASGLVMLAYGFFDWDWKPKSILQTKYVLLISILVFLFVSQKVVEQKSEFRDFLTYNSARAKVLDHPVFEEEFLDGKYKSDQPLFFLSKWLLELNPIGVTELTALSKNLQSNQWNGDQLRKSILRFIRIQKVDSFKAAISIIIILYLAFNVRTLGKNYLIRILFWFLFLFLFNHFFLLKGRVSFLFFIVLLYPIFLNQNSIQKFKGGIPLILIISFLFLYHGLNFWKGVNERQEAVNQLNQLLSSSKNIPIKFEGFPIEYLSKTYTKGEKVNFLLDGWLARSPFQTKAYAHFGFSNLCEMNEFYLIGIKDFQPFIYQDYLNASGKKFILKEKKESGYLVRYHYQE